jgi:hypothetical protein
VQRQCWPNRPGEEGSRNGRRSEDNEKEVIANHTRS